MEFDINVFFQVSMLKIEGRCTEENNEQSTRVLELLTGVVFIVHKKITGS